MYIIEVPGTPWASTSPNQQAAWNNILASNAGQNNYIADTVWTASTSAGIGWNGGNYNTYLGTQFANSPLDWQTATLMHEMAHPTTGYPSTYGGGVVDKLPPYSQQSLADNCVK
jgi:hypothetical protein